MSQGTNLASSHPTGLQAERTSHGGSMKGRNISCKNPGMWQKEISTDATGPHHREKSSNKPDLLMLVLWSIIRSELMRGFKDHATRAKSARNTTW